MALESQNYELTMNATKLPPPPPWIYGNRKQQLHSELGLGHFQKSFCLRLLIACLPKYLELVPLQVWWVNINTMEAQN